MCVENLPQTCVWLKPRRQLEASFYLSWHTLLSAIHSTTPPLLLTYGTEPAFFGDDARQQLETLLNQVLIYFSFELFYQWVPVRNNPFLNMSPFLSTSVSPGCGQTFRVTPFELFQSLSTIRESTALCHNSL